MRKDNVIALGCFYKVQLAGEDPVDELVLIGCIFSRVERECRKNETLLERIDQPRWNQQSWMERLQELFSCGNAMISRRTACYIMTIGVIDECRQMGLGTKLLNQTISLLEKQYPDCVAIWLHVIDYNESAIRFYLKNNFIKFRLLKNHYYIDKKDFDAVMLYRPIGRLRQPLDSASATTTASAAANSADEEIAGPAAE